MSGQASFITFTSIRSCSGALFVLRFLTIVSISFAVKSGVSVVCVSFMSASVPICLFAAVVAWNQSVEE